MTVRTPQWTAAVWRSELPPMAKLLALAFAASSRDFEEVEVSYPELIAMTGQCRNTVAQHKKALVSAGWLVEMVAAAQHQSATYRFAVPEGGVPPTPVRSVSEPQGGQRGLSRVPCPGCGQIVAVQPRGDGSWSVYRHRPAAGAHWCATVSVHLDTSTP